MFMGANLSLMYQFLAPNISERKPHFAFAGNVSAAVFTSLARIYFHFLT